MLSFLKNHPFAVEAFFENSFVLTFSVPKEKLQHLIPECLELDLHNDTFGFLAMAMVQTKALRPKGFPMVLGDDFFLVGYRIFVRYTTNAGKRLRGLYILKSETDRKKMEIMGNIFTHYNYTTTDIAFNKSDNRIIVASSRSDFEIEMEDHDDKTPLPQGSPFLDWKQARRFAGPLPFTFTVNNKTNEVLIIEGVRQHWEPKPLKVNHHRISFLERLNLPGAQLANAFVVSNVPYHWKKGKIDQWKG